MGLTTIINVVNIAAMSKNEYITVTEGAELVGRPAVTVRWWARKRRIRAYKSREIWLVHRESLIDYGAKFAAVSVVKAVMARAVDRLPNKLTRQRKEQRP